MTLQTLRDKIPAYAKDLNLNLSNILNSDVLTEQQLWGTLVATAMATRNRALTKLVFTDAKNHLSEAAFNVAKAACAIMGMNNVYFRFTHSIDNPVYATTPSGLRMNILAQHAGVDKPDFELWNLAVSALNGCQYCVNAHDQVLLKHGITVAQVQQAVKIAAVIHGIATLPEID